jgi:CRISPR-associated protein Csd1
VCHLNSIKKEGLKMLLEQLVAYAKRLEREGKTLPPMYQETPVPWVVQLDAAGNFIELERTSDGLGKKADRGKSIPAPKLKRTGAKAALVTDNLEYVFELPNSEAPEKAAEKRHLYRQELQACFAATQHPSIAAILHYLEQSQPPEFAPETSPKDNLTFVVDGRSVGLEPMIQQFWAAKYTDDTETDDKKEAPLIAECLVTGQVGVVMRREPLPMKGIPNGHMAGMGFISADKQPFESYGLRNSEIAPVRTQVAIQYATALNSLLENPATHLRVSPVVFAFWTKNAAIPDVPALLKNPSASPLLERLRLGQSIAADLKPNAHSSQVKKSLSSVFSGNVFSHLEPDEFYCVALSAYTSRIVVRNHLTASLREVGENLAVYFATQKLIDVSEPYGVFELASSLYRDANKDQTAQTVTALLAFALERQPLPHNYLYLLSARNRAEQRLTKPRAVLTRMSLISMEVIGMEDLSQLQADFQSADNGYQLGRLMAVLESLQWMALVKYGSSSKINTTVTDRFYSSLSSTPLLVFANVMGGAQDHLSRIRKSDPSAYTGEDKRLQQIMGQLQNIPEVLSPTEQALFSLGYYHEKADRFARIQSAKQGA